MNFAVFQIITALVGAALVVVAVTAGLYGRLPALIAFGGSGWLLASFLPTWIAGILDARRQSSQNVAG